ncbi:ATPase WRNIP1 [Megachile rotundata]|uniref:ATPase WRNIP1 n=1 Tax=Megachile rotundata TaxID=143995 RepID=UPI000258EF61|nr:PREDICTED: ATPase WRNIP1-like [Megachile rotundata]XP_012147961.1 PREDICTED: ATPase WRNIP1-like [Megachile rotundata]XP_012147962.1 PREDICTED: ATPase WRNIP1-like [Megachile rotundata]XP_012147963.1 PREDICTED: ATPase WRNIP1-like [Megachile rotundata]XP_012147964.1 PREDICTED: ATPase WRNIP1-like [Megachile rotundata]
MDQNIISCPICSKEFSAAVIESHVSKCLFLNESTSNESPASFKDESPVRKCMKLSSKKTRQGDSGSIKRKSNFMEPSLLNIDVQSSVTPSNSNQEKQSKKSLSNDHVPLAERMRPTTLSGYVGQSHIIGPSTVLYQLLNKSEIPNIILWGPPGCGKTSLANVIAHICKNKSNGKMRYVKLSAAMAGVSDVKEVITIASNELKFNRRTVVFMDEIHRFNKTQQDVFLPHVESGTIILIGATTENPSFSLNSALLSRCRVVVLEKLTTRNLMSILKKAIYSLEGCVYNSSKKAEDTERVPKFIIDEPTIEWLAETCDGDARIALGGLELAVQCKVPKEEEFLKHGPVTITLIDIEESLKKTHMLYDKKGDQHYDMISALHKSVRASDENASLYWLTRMIMGGEDPVYIARRLVRMACEDVGLADPKALGIAIHTMHGCKMIGMPECDVLLAQCTTYLAKAPKSRLMEDALRAAQRTVAEHKGPQPSVPLHLRNAPTKLMKNIGCAKGYNMRHKDESGLNYLPEGLENINFF